MLKAIIVDDEAPARSELRFLLDELGQTEVVAEAASVREAIEKLKAEGYVIEARRNKGYRLEPSADVISAAELKAALLPGTFLSGELSIPGRPPARRPGSLTPSYPQPGCRWPWRSD